MIVESAEPTLTWWRADRRRLDRERRMLRSPWQLVREGDRYLWTGGTLKGSHAGVAAPPRSARLIYPTGFPARFIEVRLVPSPPRELWGVLGTHLNVDGSVCFIAGEGWTPQMTVKEALELANDWWFNYWVIVERNVRTLLWPTRGRVVVPAAQRAALHRR